MEKLNVAQLKAVLAFASKQEIRPYIKGVYCNFSRNEVIATDGVGLIYVYGVDFGVENNGIDTVNGDVLIPCEAIENAVKGIRGTALKNVVNIGKNYIEINNVRTEFVEATEKERGKAFPLLECNKLVGKAHSTYERGNFGLFSSDNMKRVENAAKYFGPNVEYRSFDGGKLWVSLNKHHTVDIICMHLIGI